MKHFADTLTKAMADRGHNVQSLTATARFATLSSKRTPQKWLGYIDRFCLFPAQVRRLRPRLPADTIVVTLDQALGPWIPHFYGYTTVTHCHDLLSIRAARGEFPHTSVSFTGRVYQRYIARGLKATDCFIAVSRATRSDIKRIIGDTAKGCSVVYNPLAGDFVLGNAEVARKLMSLAANADLSKGFLLHVGGNVWYKNRRGLLHLYRAYQETVSEPLPLVLVGPDLSESIKREFAGEQFQQGLVKLHNVSTATLVAAYQGASALIFPSLAEGFGWPIAEAVACGCPVITTNTAPMTEVGGDAAFYLPPMPPGRGPMSEWAAAGARMVARVVQSKDANRRLLESQASATQKRFAGAGRMDEIEQLYLKASKN